MFCKNCGQVIDEGSASCAKCGAAVSADEAATRLESTSATEEVTEVKPPSKSEQATQVRPPAPAGPMAPPPPPAGASGPPATPPPLPRAVSAPPRTPAMYGTPGPPPGASGYGPGWQPPQGPLVPKSRTGLIVGIVTAAVIILAGAGVGIYFGFFRDGDDSAGNGGTATSKTTVAGSSTTGTIAGGSSTTGTQAGGSSTTGTGQTTSTGAGSSSTVIGSSTSQTIPSLTSSTSGSSTSTTRSTTTTTTEDPAQVYLAFTDTVVAELEHDDARIPELATEINKTLPRVPVWVRDELQHMLDALGEYHDQFWTLEVPAPFAESFTYLDAATTNMEDRIALTIAGIEAMWSTGDKSAGNTYFESGRTERDRYRANMAKFHEALPID